MEKAHQLLGQAMLGDGGGGSCITQLKTQGPSRTCNESTEEEEENGGE